jgi:hypothetical protein
VDGWSDQPAFVLGRRGDVLATNHLARALLADFDAMPYRDRNLTKWILLDPATRQLYVDWAQIAAEMVAILRLDAGAHPDDPRTTELVGELTALHAISDTCVAYVALRDGSGRPRQDGAGRAGQRRKPRVAAEPPGVDFGVGAAQFVAKTGTGPAAPGAGVRAPQRRRPRARYGRAAHRRGSSPRRLSQGPVAHTGDQRFARVNATDGGCRGSRLSTAP